jgi:hypothetical protein
LNGIVDVLKAVEKLMVNAEVEALTIEEFPIALNPDVKNGEVVAVMALAPLPYMNPESVAAPVPPHGTCSVEVEVKALVPLPIRSPFT